MPRQSDKNHNTDPARIKINARQLADGTADGHVNQASSYVYVLPLTVLRRKYFVVNLYFSYYETKAKNASAQDITAIDAGFRKNFCHPFVCAEQLISIAQKSMQEGSYEFKNRYCRYLHDPSAAKQQPEYTELAVPLAPKGAPKSEMYPYFSELVHAYDRLLSRSPNINMLNLTAHKISADKLTALPSSVQAFINALSRADRVNNSKKIFYLENRNNQAFIDLFAAAADPELARVTAAHPKDKYLSFIGDAAKHLTAFDAEYKRCQALSQKLIDDPGADILADCTDIGQLSSDTAIFANRTLHRISALCGDSTGAAKANTQGAAKKQK